MEIITGFAFLPCNCISQICCWYYFFHVFGCIEDEREEIHTQPPTPPNPFTHPGLPKDNHLLPAYG